MPKFVIPRADAEQPNKGGGSDLFPKGVWQGTIEVTRIAEAVREPRSGPVFCLSEGAEYGEVGSVQIGGITAVVKDQPDVGQRKFFDDQLLLSESFTGGTVVQWDEPTGSDDENWRFDQTRRRLTNLALALGTTEDDGNGGVGPVENFGDLFREAVVEGQGISGMQVTFEVDHRTYKTKTGEKGTAHFLKVYLPA
jgi:hypothetical protein